MEVASAGGAPGEVTSLSGQYLQGCPGARLRFYQRHSSACPGGREAREEWKGGGLMEGQVRGVKRKVEGWEEDSVGSLSRLARKVLFNEH